MYTPDNLVIIKCDDGKDPHYRVLAGWSGGYTTGSLDAFASMCKLRLKEDTQYESRLVAQQVSAKMAELYPVSWEALVGDNND